MIRALLTAPLPALVLGLGGLLPFFVLTTLACAWPEYGYAYWLATLAQYGAVILSFVGALHWAYAVGERASGRRAWARSGWSVVPALVGWSSLQLPVWTSLRVQAATFVLALGADRLLRAPAATPAWLVPLRYVLTVFAAACLGIASYA